MILLSAAIAASLIINQPSGSIPTTLVEGDRKFYAGKYECTAYESTGNPCADGVYPCEGVTVASNDPQLWHKVVELKGTGTEWDGLYYVHDTGGMSSNVIDIYIDDYNECIEFGRRKNVEVYFFEDE